MDKESMDKAMAKVVNSLVALVEYSSGNWIKPWVDLGLGRQYRSNGEPYQGVNQIFLSLIAVSLGLDGPHIWAGYNTWHKTGWQVRKGERSLYNPIYAYPVVVCKEHGRGDPGEEKCCPTQVRFMKTKVLRGVFHRSQVEPRSDLAPGEEPTLPAIPGVKPHAVIEIPTIVETWKLGGMEFRGVDPARAFYSPSLDYINLPPPEAFTDQHGYHSTLLHEAIHWTGHSSRLDRPTPSRFGSPGYAQEELIAEMGSAMTGAVLGFEPEPHENHGEYLASWLKALKGDPSRLYDTAVDAEKASRYLLELGKVSTEAIAA